MQDTKLRFRNIFMSVYILAIVALLVLPMLKLKVDYVPIILFTLPFWFIYIMQKKKNIIAICSYLFLLSFMFIFNFLINTPLSIQTSINNSILLYLCYFPYFIFDYLINLNNKWEMKFVLIGATAIFIFIIIMTSKAFFDDPVIARRLAIGSEDDEYLNEMRMKNIGGYGFSYAVGMFIPYVAMKIIRSAGKTKALFIIMFIALFVYAFFCQYTMLLILSIIFSTIIFIMGSKSVITKAVLLFSSLVILINLTGIFKFLGYNLPFVSLAYHFRELYISLSTGEDTTSRILSIKRCIGLFRQHPFFGANLFESYNKYIVSHSHSTYFGLLASNGLAGFFVLVSFVYILFKSIVSRIENNFVVIIYIAYITLGVLNPTLNEFEISVSVFLLIPLIEFYESRIKEQKYAEQ